MRNNKRKSKKEIKLTDKMIEEFVAAGTQRDKLVLFLAAELYSYEWVKEYFPEFYKCCEERL